MAINIKSSEVKRLIQQLRELKGEGPTEIIKAALAREYQVQRKRRRKAQLEAQLSEIQRQAQAKAQDFNSDDLYDEKGLPQ